MEKIKDPKSLWEQGKNSEWHSIARNQRCLYFSLRAFCFQFLFTYLAAWGFHCCVRTFSSCIKLGLLSSWVHRLPLWWPPVLRSTALGAQAPEYSFGTRAQLLQGMWNLPDQGLNSRPPVGRKILNQWTTREVPESLFVFKGVMS